MICGFARTDKRKKCNFRDYLALRNHDETGEPMLDRVLSGFFTEEEMQDYTKEVRKEVRGY